MERQEAVKEIVDAFEGMLSEVQGSKCDREKNIPWIMEVLTAVGISKEEVKDEWFWWSDDNFRI